MDVPTRQEETPQSPPDAETDSIITSHETRPGKVVFTERNNTDAWIATDATTTLDP